MEKKIKYLDKLLKLGIPKDNFCLIQSAWFPVMDMRQNGDLDFIITSDIVEKYKDIILKVPKLNIKINNKNYHKFGCTSDDDLINNYSVIIDNFHFCEFRFYYDILRNRSRQVREDKKRKHGTCDYTNLKNFFKNNKHLQPPFDQIPLHTWGYDL